MRMHPCVPGVEVYKLRDHGNEEGPHHVMGVAMEGGSMR